MRNKILMFIVALGCSMILTAQNISLDEVTAASRQTYPLLKMNVLNEQLTDLKLKTVNASWMPSVTLNMQATYQSDITALPIELPGVDIPDLYKDQYKASIDVSQMIYDGGLSTARKDIEYANLQVQQEELNMSLKEIELMAADLYFGILRLQKSKEQLELMKTVLEEQISILQSGVKNGVVLQSTLDQILVEQLTLQQKLADIEALIETNMNVLTLLSGLSLDESTGFVVPELTGIEQDYLLQTSELRLFELNDTKLASSEDLYKVQKMPMVAAFAQFGYGRPGLNMFTNTFDEYYILGVKATWKLWSGGKNNRNIEAVQVQRQMLETQKESYILNMEFSRSRMWNEIESLENQLQTDEEIFELRSSIFKSYDSQFKNGVITVDEYLRHLNNKTLAAISLEMHKIQLQKAKYDYLRTFGK